MSSQAQHRGSAHSGRFKPTRFERHTARMPEVCLRDQDHDADREAQLAATDPPDTGARLDPFVRMLAIGVARRKFRFRGYTTIQAALMMGLLAMLLALVMIVGVKLGGR